MGVLARAAGVATTLREQSQHLAPVQPGHRAERLVAAPREVLVSVQVIQGATLGEAAREPLDDAQGLDRADQQYLSQASYRSFESGAPVQWRNPDSGNYGTVSPGRTYQSQYGGYCREYTQTVYIGGQPQKAYGTACRQPDGSWQIQNS